PGRAQTLDFTGKSLVGILGDTGAGKTTILEAITLALYGASSWGSEVKELIAEGATSMTVELTFTHDGHTWRIRRVYYAGSRPSRHLLENLDAGDKGEKIDNRGAVNRRVESLLKLRRDDFQAAVLLPQGRFDRLLTAPEAKRTELLKGIFGTRSLEATRDLAAHHREVVRDLLDQVRDARSGYLPDPTEAAKAAALAAQDAQQRKVWLEGVFSRMSGLQATAARHARRLADLDDAYRTLSDNRSMPDTAVLADLAVTEQELAAAEDHLTSRETRAAAQREQTQQQLDTAAAEGVTVETVAAATTVLSGLPGRLSSLRQTEDRLTAEQQRIADATARLNDEDDRIAELQRGAEQLSEQATTVDTDAARTVNAATVLQQATLAVISAAITVAEAEAAQATATAAHLAAQAELPRLRETATAAQDKVHEATLAVDAVTRAEAAHTAGQGLHPGDACTVCAQDLPENYSPPEPADPAQLAQAKKARSAAERGANKALHQLALGEAAVQAAQRELSKADAAHQAALRLVGEATTNAKTAAASPDLHTPSAPTPAFDAGTFSRKLDSIVHTLQQRPDTVQVTTKPDATELTQRLCALAHEQARRLTETAEAAKRNAQTAANEAHTATQVLAAHQTNLAKEVNAHEAARTAHGASAQALAEDLAHLPQVISSRLPTPVLAIAPGDIDAAQHTLGELSSRIQAATQDLHAAADDLRAVGDARLKLARRRETAVRTPLTTLLTAVSAHLSEAQRAQTLLDPNLPQIPLPAPQHLTVQTGQDICAAAAATTADLLAKFHDARATAESSLAAAQARLEREAELLRSDEAGPLVSLGADIALHEPQALAPLSEAIGAARDTYTKQTDLARQARDQIEAVRTLDHAIAQGTARVEILTTLHRLLADGKFLTYLTERRTLALLGVAGELFARLSSGRYGFTDNFRIVNLATRTVRSPKTLSGGETFLASLALALALVELHSRNGARLGSLFLDEGFGALDSTALASALSVLRTESGGDKLVMVISHLRAVAEAVDDVLWIQRTATGSQTRWLTDNERDALVYDQAQSGLLALAEHAR
ncbi:MAG: AAA family ATPase, partial [Actinoallomurus sp.]